MFGRSDVRWGLVLLAVLLCTGVCRAERLKELATVRGMRSNQLVGYGLVVGLSQTGDDYNVPFTQQSIMALLKRMGSPVVDPTLLRTRDTAAVLVTALVPPFAKSGMQVDVNVAALGNARSLQGGVLISTPLRSVDGLSYAVAQGPLLIGGLLATGASGSISLRNHVTTGRIPEGAIVERDMPNGLRSEVLTFLLKRPDFTTANRVARVIEQSLAQSDQPAATAQGGQVLGRTTDRTIVRAVDAGTVEVAVPLRLRDQAVAMAAQLEELEVDADGPARVVVNERTGVVVIGANVRLGHAAVSYGRLTVRVDEVPIVSQPGPLSPGQTTVSALSQVQQHEVRGPLQVVGPAAKVEDVVQSLNQLGTTTRELLAVLQALKAAGALQGELIIE